MKTYSNSDWWVILTNAIVQQAATDYLNAKKVLKKDRNDKNAKKVLNECLEFFRSEWFADLTNAEPEAIITYLNRKSDRKKIRSLKK